MKLASITSSITTLTLLGSYCLPFLFFFFFFFLGHAAAAPQSITFEKQEPNDNDDGNNQGIQLTTYPVGRPKQVYNFHLTRGLAIESLGMVSDIVVAQLDKAPEDTVCLFWRLDDENKSFLDRMNVLQRGTVNLSMIRRAFTVTCYDKNRPEFLTGYRDQ